MKYLFNKKPAFVFWCGLLAAALSWQAFGQAATGTRPVLGVLEIEPTEGVAQQVRSAGDSLSIKRLQGSLDVQLIERLAAKRRFRVAARTDLETLLKDSDLQQVFAADPVQAFKMAGCQYGLIVRMTDFVDDSRDVLTETGGVLSRTRSLRIALTGTIYDLESNTVLESVTAVYQDTFSRLGMSGEGRADGKSDEGGQILGQASAALADHLAQKVVDRVYPPRVLLVAGNRVMINRGSDAGVRVGESWQVMAVQEVADPDFPSETVRVEMPMGTMVISQVLANQSQGELRENFGVSQGMIARPAPPLAPAPVETVFQATMP